MRFAVTIAALFLAATTFNISVKAQDATAPEHPIVKHYPGATVDGAEVRDFDAVDVVTGYNAGPEPKVTIETIEGRISKYQYTNDPKNSPLQVVRNYENALKQAGFKTIVVVKGDKVEIPSVGVGDTFGSFRLDKDGAPRIYVNVKATTDTTYVSSEVLIVEPKAMEQEYTVGAGEMYDSLQKSGRVAVYGITFDTGKSTIQPASEKVLAEVVKLLEQHPNLKLQVEGHTDNVGSPASNRTLSEARAAAVKAWLVGRGVKEGRLGASGFGDAKPVASNATDEGKAKNRRVELVRVK